MSLQKNAQKWAATEPKYAVLLPYCEDDDLNLVKEELKDAEEWVASHDLDDVSVLYIYGVGLGFFYDALKGWLKKKRKRHLVFLEDDLSVIYRLFKTKRGGEILKNPKVHLCYFSEVKEIHTKLEVLMNHHLKAKILVGALPFYERERRFDEVQREVVYESVMRNALFDEYLRYGASFYRNFYQNLRKLPGSYMGNRFFGKFKGVPAIICGAGPSLEKNAHLLKELGDRALIFAGGSAMNALNAKGIIPHFGAGVDPNAMQYDRLASNTAYEVPYFYRNRMFWKAFDHIHGPRLYISGAGGYEVSKYFDEAFGIEEEEIDEGHNVVNFCVEIATRMGCSPIIFAGVDLAFTEKQAYASGIVAERNMENFASENFEDKPIERTDIFGKPIDTLWKWVAESDWTGEYAREHPLITFINATEGGLGFPGVRNLPLAEVSRKFLNRSYDLLGRVHGETQNSACPEVTAQRIEELMSELAASLKRCIEHLNILLEENGKLQKVEDPPVLQTGLAVLAETELEEEPAYRYILEVFSGVSAMLLNYEFRQLKKNKKKRLKLNERKLKFVAQAAEFNLVLLEDALTGKNTYV